MKVIESKIVGKKNEETCEDGMAITADFIAVIDGSTSKTPKQLNPDMRNGRYAMMLVSEYIREELRAEATVDDFCQGVTDYICNKVYVPLNMIGRLELHPEERLTASAILYSRARREVWMVGDCQAIIDGFPIYQKGVSVVSVLESSEVVMASDGYPFLRNTLAESEAALADQIANDSQNVGSFIATKGLVGGQKSFDDRTFVRFRNGNETNCTAENLQYMTK